jgi:DNA-binding transcriptional LysR family regulator
VRLAWIAADSALADPARTLPLILYPPPSTSRAIALETLERVGRPWRIVCTSTSLSGLNATALAGLGVCVQCDGFAAAGLSEVPCSAQLPELGSIEFCHHQQRAHSAWPYKMHWRRPYATTPIDYRLLTRLIARKGKNAP